MAEWQKKTLRLKDGHGWTARPGCSVLVADRGAVRFDYPEGWVILPGENGSLKLHDRSPPDDDCTLQMSIFYLNPQIDWRALPLKPLVERLLEDDSRFILDRGEVISFERDRTEVAWSEIRFMDPNEARPAFSRTCIARRRNIQPLITFDYWENDAPRCRAVWDTLMETLCVGEMIADPTVGPARRDRDRIHDRGKGKGKGPGRKAP